MHRRTLPACHWHCIMAEVASHKKGPHAGGARRTRAACMGMALALQCMALVRGGSCHPVAVPVPVPVPVPLQARHGSLGVGRYPGISMGGRKQCTESCGGNGVSLAYHMVSMTMPVRPRAGRRPAAAVQLGHCCQYRYRYRAIATACATWPPLR